MHDVLQIPRGDFLSFLVFSFGFFPGRAYCIHIDSVCMYVRSMHPSTRPCIYDVLHTGAAGRERCQLKADGFFIKWFGGEKRTAPNGNLTAFTRVFL